MTGRGWAFALFGAAQLALLVPMARYEQRMKASGGPGIIPFELLGTQERARAVMERWGEDGRAAARSSLRLDFAYLVSYTGLQVAGCAAARDALADRGWDALAAAGDVIGPGQVLAGACDAVENASLLGVLAGRGDRLPAVARTFALAKFGVLFVGWGYALLGLAARLTR